MILRELVVQDFRGFEGRTAFPFSEHFTVIAGVNGRGKTSILDALASVLMRLLGDLGLSTSNRFGRWKVSDIYDPAESASVAVSALCAGIPVNNFCVHLDRRPRTSQVITHATPLAPATVESVVAGYGEPSRTGDEAPLAMYYTTDRASYRRPKVLPTDLPPLAQAAYRGALSSRMVDYRDLMARYRLWAQKPAGRELNAFRRALAAFLDGFSDVAVEDDPPRLTMRKGQVRVSLEQLSDGERAFLAVVGDMVRRLALANPELDNPLEGHGVALIDELELHLHPRWQREVAEKLRATFPNIQFIATTHSPFIIQSLRPGELITLDPEEFGEYANRSVEDIAEHVMGVEVPQKSERYLEMMKAAEEYYRLLREAPEQAQAAEAKLAELTSRFSDDPAYQALLRVERATRRGTIDASR